MKVALIGPELEENLGLRYLHSSIERSGHKALIFNFHAAAQTPALVPRILDYDPDVVGLSMVFTGRAREFLGLAQALRDAGFNGHITAGGHFASFHARKLLTDFPALNSIVHGEGEGTVADMIDHLAQLDAVPGISYTTGTGAVSKTAPRPNPDDLDSLPLPLRPSCFHTYLGLPIANMLGSRGCYGNCNYCSISAWYKQNLGRRFRQRSVENIAREMADLYHERGVRIFNFHDDNFFLADTRQSADRFAALRDRLEDLGLGRIAVQVKARPDSVHEEPIAILKEMGLFRVFLGVESNSAAGLKTLGRGIPTQDNHRALDVLRGFDIHTTFNLLMFDPETTLADVRKNIAFMRKYAQIPLNFGRTEVYSGTALEKTLRSQNRLEGSFLGYSYVISDDKAQKAFEIYRRVFLGRNFDANGMNLQAMKLDYHFYLLQHFFPRRAGKSLRTRVKRLIAKLNNNSAAILSEICDFLNSPRADNPAALDSFAEKLARSRIKFDSGLSPQSQALLEQIKKPVLGSNAALRPSAAVAASAAAAVLIMTVVGCDGSGKDENPPPAPNDTVAAQPQIRQLSQKEFKDVETLIQSKYQGSVYVLLAKHKLTDTKVAVDLLIDSAGKATAANMQMASGQRNEAFEKELEEQIKQWVFPQVKKQGTCRVTLDYKIKLPDWHMCEMMAAPLDPIEPKKTTEK